MNFRRLFATPTGRFIHDGNRGEQGVNIKELAEQANGRFEQAWPGGVIWYWDELAKFAELVAAHDREECAKLCDARVMGDNNREDMEAKKCADAIRARGNT